jgi:hypothetical protein
MEQEGIRPNPAEACRFGDETELKTALTGILHQLRSVSPVCQFVPDRHAHMPEVIVRITAFSTIAGCVPHPLLLGYDMMQQDDRCSNVGHEIVKELPLSFRKVSNLHRCQGTAWPCLNQTENIIVHIYPAGHLRHQPPLRHVPCISIVRPHCTAINRSP